MGHDIPGRVRVVGVDDVKYAKYLRVPLTTYRQPLEAIAKAATDLMLSRIANPRTPAKATSQRAPSIRCVRRMWQPPWRETILFGLSVVPT